MQLEDLQDYVNVKILNCVRNVHACTQVAYWYVRKRTINMRSYSYSYTKNGNIRSDA